MLLRLLTLFLICFSLFSCKGENGKEKTISDPPIKEIKDRKPVLEEQSESFETVDKKEPDSINNKNTIAFLKKYGSLNKETELVIKTRLGDIGIRLYEDTPLHRASFVFLAKMGYFDTTCFYRVVPDFIIQGGESERLDTQRYKAKYMRYKIPPEFREQRKHKYGAIALARDWVNNPQKKSTAFEFYIIQNRKGAHHLDGEHTVFGEVTSGFDTIDRIVNLQAGSDEWPLQDVFMKIEIIN